MKLNKIETPHFIQKKISAPIPEYVIQERDAGRGNKLSYISGATVIDMLNSTFGHMGWSSEIIAQWKEQSEPYFDTYAKVPDTEKITNAAGKKGIWVNQAPVVFVKVRLTVYLERPDGSLHAITKEAFGSKAVIGKQNEQDSTYKSAQTDALKKAASLLGIGTELYRGEDEQVYHDTISKPLIWTEEKIEKSDEWQAILEIVNEQGWTVDALDYFVNELTEGQYTDIYTLPEIWLSGLVDNIKAEITGGE